MIHFRSLDGISFEDLLDAFNDAFSEYSLQIQMSLEKFKVTLQRRNADLTLSFGLFEANYLVAFAINGIRCWNKELTAYDCFTGVRIKYQNQKLGKRLFDEMLPYLQTAGIKNYLLEVIQDNTPAVNLYSKKGFQIVRKYLCVSIPKDEFKLLEKNTNATKKISPNDIELIRQDTLPWDELPKFWEAPPSWQNSIESVQAVLSEFTFYGLFLQKMMVGYFVVDPKNGDTLQFGILPEFRHQYLGHYLFCSVAQDQKFSHFKIINIDENALETLKFLKKHNFSVITTQFEMMLKIN